jgi:hypothetical protein
LTDGSRLRRFRFWHLLSRSLFALDLLDEFGRPHRYEVDVHHLRDESSEKRPAALYRDGVQVLEATVTTAASRCCARTRGRWRDGGPGSSGATPARAR